MADMIATALPVSTLPREENDVPLDVLPEFALALTTLFSV